MAPIHDLCSKGDVAGVKDLLTANVDVNSIDLSHANKQLPLHAACSPLSSVELVQLLLDWGADIEARTATGWTALHLLCWEFHTNAKEIMALLLRSGADINARTEMNWTPLHVACVQGHTRAIHLLIIRGADLMAKCDPDGRTPIDMCKDKFMKWYMTEAIQHKQNEANIERLAECFEIARRESRLLSEEALKLRFPTNKVTSVAHILADADACYNHITRIRHTRQPVIDLITGCCDVLRKVATCSAVEAERADLAEARSAYEAFSVLQAHIRDADGMRDESTITKRNDMRNKCIELIATVLQNQKVDTNADIRVRATDALSKLRRRASRKAMRHDELKLEDLRKACEIACTKGERYAAELGLNSTQSQRCDEAVKNAREALTDTLLRGFGYKAASAADGKTCIDKCITGLHEEYEFLEGGAKYLNELSTSVGVLVSLENALMSIIRYYDRGVELDIEYTTLAEKLAILREGITHPNASFMKDLYTNRTAIAREREKWDARIVLAANQSEAENIREQRSVWEVETRNREKTANRDMATWLQFTGTHYPELLHSPDTKLCFTWEYAMECAALGLLQTADSIVNYQHVKWLSEKNGRPVKLLIDPEGKHVVRKSYSLTNSEHFSHFMNTCRKMGAMRGVLNIVPVLGVYTESHFGHVLMHYCEGGDLATWIHDNPQRDPKMCLRIAHQIVLAVAGLHERDVVHCDMKPENIFLTATLEAVLGDFDDIRDADYTMTTPMGVTRKYEAPELRAGKVSRFEKSADVYSLGLVLSELFNGVTVSGVAGSISDDSISALVAKMSAELPLQRPPLSQVTSNIIFKDVQSARLCAICFEAYVATEGVMCSNGHLTCNGCLNDWLRFDLNNTSYVTQNAGRLPCSMQMHGCQKVWEPNVYASHVEQNLFDETMCLVNKPTVRTELLLEQQRQAAQDREFHHIADEILTLRCPGGNHVLDTSFDSCFSLTCDACPKECNEFCAFCWRAFGWNTHKHVKRCSLNPNPGAVYNAIDEFYKIKRQERENKLMDYWATLQMDCNAKEELAKRIQPLLDQLKPEGTYKSIAELTNMCRFGCKDGSCEFRDLP